MDTPIKVFTALEKKNLLWRVLFRCLDLNHVDFSDADLRGVLFDDTSLRGCDFTGADLRGAIFLCCDLAQARLDRAILFGSRFPGSSLAGSSGLTREQVEYVLEHGGIFVTQASSDMEALPEAHASR